MTLILIQIDLSNITQSYNSSNKLRITADSCFEETMYKLVRDPNFTGTLPMSFPESQNSCNISIQNDAANPALKIVTITSTDTQYSAELQKKVDTSSEPYEVTNL